MSTSDDQIQQPDPSTLEKDLRDFVFKPFAEMAPEDYLQIGFRSGLEIHQQLLTAKKLFCRCPAGLYSERFDAEILRHMRPTLSELGEYDGTALMEFKTRKEILYHINRETVCTYEMDDTPPFELNDEALDIALGVGLLYRCAMVHEIHIARKQYLDGSIPTGFQRTTIVGVDGRIPYENREIRIIQLGLEEDSCREVSDIGHRRVYLTDRLGMPLIETVTAPDMRSPREVAGVADVLRRLTRSTGKVRTGIGAARQDVNVSVTGGTRVEIKGVPRIPAIPLLTHNEAMRQWNLLRLRAELRRRGVTPDTFESRADDVTRILKKTRYEPIRNAIAAGMVVRCVTLRRFRGLLRWATQTDTHFSREVMDRVRVIACLTVLPNIVHSDSHSDTISNSEWQAVRKAGGASDEDTLVLVWGDAIDADTGAREVAIRAREAAVGVPSETRQALRDGTNGFERILPGPNRMYPDTDLPPRRITAGRLESIRSTLPEYFWEREAWYRSLGLPEDVVRPLAVSPLSGVFRQAVKEWGADPVAAGVALIQYPKRLRKKGLSEGHPSPRIMGECIRAYAEGRVAREGVLMLMEQAAKGGGSLSPDALPPPVEPGEVGEVLRWATGAMAHMPGSRSEAKFRAVMGLAMRSLRGRAAGADMARCLRGLMGEVKP